MSAGHIPGTHKRTDIEGLRAVAVSLVLLYHLKIATFSGGYVGVDVFFVVSGFLITQILIDEVDKTGKIHLRDFWARRMRRIVPMASLVVVLTVIASYVYLEKGRGNELIPVAIGALGFCANFVLHNTTGDYLSGVALPSPLQHYWSLGVEEQFYLLWPIILMVVAKLGKVSWRFASAIVCGVLFVWSLTNSIRTTPIDHSAGYFLPQNRAWEILAGAMLAILGSRLLNLPKVLAAAMGWAGLGAIVFAAVTFDEQSNFPGSLALVPVLGAVAILISAEVDGGPVSILRVAPLQRIGLWSFSLYLWHWPVLVIMESQFGVLTSVEKVVAVIVSLVLSGISYTVIEHPIQWSKYLSEEPKRTFAVGFSALALLLATGTVLIAIRPTTDGTPAFAAPPGLEEAQEDAASSTLVPKVGGPLTETTVQPVTTEAPPAATPVNALLVGDSVLAEVRWFEQGAFALQGFTFTLDAESCRRLSFNSCEGREDRTPNSATSVVESFAAPVDVVVLVGGYHADNDSIREELQTFANAVSAKGMKLVILTFKETLTFPSPGSDGTRSIYTDFNETLRAMAEEGVLGDVTIADWNLFSYEGVDWFRSDGMHTNIVGTLALGWFISATLAELYNNPCPVNGAYPCEVPEIAPAIDWLATYGVAYTDDHCYEDGADRVRVCEQDRQM